MKYEKISEYSNTKFRRITGVKRATFDKMVEILRKGYTEKHRRRGRTPKLRIEDQLLATLEYLREYRLNTALKGFTFSIEVFGLSVRLRATKRNHGITGSAFLQTKDKIYLSSEL